MSGGRLIETVGDDGSRLMIEAAQQAEQNPAYEVAAFFMRTMMKRKKTYLIHIVLATLLLNGCIHEGILIETPSALMLYESKPTEARLLALAKAYATTINQNLEKQTPRPGQYADYGVALAKLGCTKQANIMFNNEMMLFPNSSLYVDFLKQTLAPNYMSDRTVDTSKIDLLLLDTIHVTLTPEEAALKQEMENDPEYKRMMKQKEQEMRKREAAAKREAKRKKN